MHSEPLRLASSRDARSKFTRFLCARRQRSTIVETRAQRARRAPPVLQQGNMNLGQEAPPAQPAAPPAQPAVAAVPPVLPAPPAPLPVPPAPPAFALGLGRSHTILNFDDPNTGATATKLYNKAIAPLEAKFDGEADILAVFLASVRDRARRFNWHRLITVPIDDGTTRNLLTHYGQVSLDNARAHATTYVNTPTRDAQDNDMFYYFLADSLTNEFRATVLLYTDTYTVTNVPVASALLKRIIILTRVDNPASTMHIREMLIGSKQKLLQLKGNITEFNQWVRKQMGRLHDREQETVDLLYYLWKAYKAAPDEEFVVYIKDLKSQADDGRATYTAEDLMVRAENKYEALDLIYFELMRRCWFCWFCVFETPSLILSLDMFTVCICASSPDEVFTFPIESAGLSLDSIRPSPVSPVSCNT